MYAPEEVPVDLTPIYDQLTKILQKLEAISEQINDISVNSKTDSASYNELLMLVKSALNLRINLDKDEQKIMELLKAKLRKKET